MGLIRYIYEVTPSHEGECTTQSHPPGGAECRVEVYLLGHVRGLKSYQDEIALALTDFDRQRHRPLGCRVFASMSHALVTLFNRPQAGLAKVVGAHNVVKAGKQQRQTASMHRYLHIDVPFAPFVVASFLFGPIFHLSSELGTTLFSLSFEWLDDACCRSHGVQMILSKY